MALWHTLSHYQAVDSQNTLAYDVPKERAMGPDARPGTPGFPIDTAKAEVISPIERGRFHGLTAVVTGVSNEGSIGPVLCQSLASEGITGILATARPHSQEKGDAIVTALRSPQTEAYWVGADLTQEEGISTVANEVKERFGSVDLLFLNAGAPFDENFSRMTSDKLRANLEVNLIAPILLTQRMYAEKLIKPGGRVVVNGSFIGIYGRKDQVGYAAAKAGLTGFIAAAAQELAPSGITINGVFPGYIDTEMTAGTPANYRKAYVDATPLKRLGTSEDVAYYMMAFSDPRAGFSTGQVLVLDGGLGNPGAIDQLLGSDYIWVNRSERKAVMDMRRSQRPGGEV